MTYKEHECPIGDVALEDENGAVVCGCFEYLYLPKNIHEEIWMHVSEDDSIAVRKLSSGFGPDDLVDFDRFLAVVEDAVSRITLTYMKKKFIKIALLKMALAMQAHDEIHELEESE